MPSDGPVDPFDFGAELSELCAINADKVAGWTEKGIDPKPHRAVIFKHVNGKSERCDGVWPVSEVNRDFLKARWGPGTYTVQVVNVNNQILARNGASIEGPVGVTSSSSTPLGALPASDGELVRFLLAKLLESREPRQDPMREVVASMASLMQVQIAAMNADRANQARAPTDETASKLLLAIVPELVKARVAPAPNGQGARGGAVSSIDEFLRVLQFGMALSGAAAKGKSKKENPDDDETKWLEVLPNIVDSIGPGLVTTLALAILPKEKADQAIDTIQTHMRAREAEAKAEEKAPPIDTDGVPMP